VNKCNSYKSFYDVFVLGKATRVPQINAVEWNILIDIPMQCWHTRTCSQWRAVYFI